MLKISEEVTKYGIAAIEKAFDKSGVRSLKALWLSVCNTFQNYNWNMEHVENKYDTLKRKNIMYNLRNFD